MTNLFLTPIEKLERFAYHLKLFKTNSTFEQTLFQYFEQRLKTYLWEYDAGTLEHHSDDEWSDINLRGGILSVEGTECEMIAAMYLITTGCTIEMVDTKDHQVAGIDFYITKSSWKHKYSVSVKKRPKNNESIVLYRSDFPSTNIVDRIVFVDPILGFVLQGDYKYLHSVYNNRKDKQVDNVRVPIVNLTDSTILKTQDIKTIIGA